jgi:hypothetical protein
MFVCLFIAQALYQTKRKISLTLFDVPRAGGACSFASRSARSHQALPRLCLSFKVNLRQSTVCNIPRWRILHHVELRGA